MTSVVWFLGGLLAGMVLSRTAGQRDVIQLRREYEQARNRMLQSQHAYDNLSHLYTTMINDTAVMQESQRLN